MASVPRETWKGKIKVGRSSSTTLIVHISRGGCLSHCKKGAEKAHPLMERFWGGPSLYYGKVRSTRRGQRRLEIVAVRSAHPAANALIRLACWWRRPALIFREAKPNNSPPRYRGPNGRVDCIIDGGSCMYGIESTARI